jgi:putative Ca2+/H+ antiporter (TMEM165/GDT1 family)
MNFAIAAAVFPIIFIGELPDKTMFASLVMSTRGKPFAVWFGAAAAFTIHVVIATTVGVALFHVVPHRALEAIVAGLFLAGAGLALREGLRERQYEEREERLVEAEVGAHGRRTFTTSFIVIFVAEWGDLTQILTANLAARYHSPVSVGVGAVVALWTVAAIAVAGGQTLLRIVNVTTVRFVTAVVLTGLAGYTAWLAAR